MAAIACRTLITKPPFLLLRRIRSLTAGCSRSYYGGGSARPNFHIYAPPTPSTPPLPKVYTPRPLPPMPSPKPASPPPGCDYFHWFVVVDPPHKDNSREDIIDTYVKTLANVLGSEEAARLSIYSVSTKYYYSFGCIVSEGIASKLKCSPIVRSVLADSYLDVKEKTYGGEPFINGKAVPYDPKYHKDWEKNNSAESKSHNAQSHNVAESENVQKEKMDCEKNNAGSKSHNTQSHNVVDSKNAQKEKTDDVVADNLIAEQSKNFEEETKEDNKVDKKREIIARIVIDKAKDFEGKIRNMDTTVVHVTTPSHSPMEIRIRI